MSRSVRDLFAALARGGKDFKSIKTLTDECYKENTLSRTQIYRIMKDFKDWKEVIDDRGNNTPQRVWIDNLIAEIAAGI